jgi:hypothetical protein
MHSDHDRWRIDVRADGWLPFAFLDSKTSNRLSRLGAVARQPIASSDTSARTYDTRIDRLRARLGIAPSAWADATRKPRGQLLRYRSNQAEPRCSVLADLVRGTRKLTQEPLRASDFYDLGEAEPLGSVQPTQRGWRRSRKFDTRFDRLLRTHSIIPSILATETGLSRRLIGLLQAGKLDPKVSTLAKLVRALRRMGADVCANDVVDIGDTAGAAIGAKSPDSKARSQ